MTDMSQTPPEPVPEDTGITLSPEKKVVDLARPTVSVNSHSRPVVRKSIELATAQSQRICERTFSRTVYSFFSIEVILQIIGEEEAVDKARENIGKLIQNCESTIDTQIAQLDEVIATHQLEQNSGYSNPATYHVEITSPLAMQYGRLLLKLDHMLKLIDTLWMNGYLQSRQRTRAMYDWSSNFRRLSSRIISIEKIARIQAHTRGKQAEVDAMAPNRPDIEEAAHESDAPEASSSHSTPAAE